MKKSKRTISKRFFVTAVIIFASLAAANAEQIGIFLGTFDPPHTGIALMINEAKSQMNLDNVYVVPTPEAVDRPEVTPVHHRLNMLKLLSNSTRAFTTLSEEDLIAVASRRPENLFAALREDIISRRPSEDEIIQIVGEDALPKLIARNQLPQKNERRKLLVFPRKGTSLTRYPKLTELEKTGKFLRLQVETPDVSGQDLRTLLKSGKQPPANLLPESIYFYIKREGLYGLEKPQLSREIFSEIMLPNHVYAPVLLHSPNTDTVFVPSHFESYLDETDAPSTSRSHSELPTQIRDLLRNYNVEITIFQSPTTDALDWLETQGWRTFFGFVPKAADYYNWPMFFFSRNDGAEWHLFITGIYAEQRFRQMLQELDQVLTDSGISKSRINILIQQN